jgi:hypothetical protein
MIGHRNGLFERGVEKVEILDKTGFEGPAFPVLTAERYLSFRISSSPTVIPLSKFAY